MGKPSAPSPPDPMRTSAAQTGTNVSTGVANAFLNNVNQNTPEGSLQYDVTGTHSWTDPSTGHSYNIPTFTSTQSLSPQSQAIQSQLNAAKMNMAGMANTQSGRISDLLSTPFNPTGSAPGAGDPNAIKKIPGAATSYDPGGDITRSYGAGDFSEDRQRVEQSLMDRMNPQLARERGSIEQRLADQGIRYGSQAYASAMDDYNRQATDARFAAIGQAGSEQQRMMDMAAQRAGFQNAAQAQANSQNAALAGFGNAGLAQQLAQAQSGFNADNSARNQYLQEQYQQRNQPLNEISALMGGSQVQQPNWLNSPNSQIATTDFAGITGQNAALQQQNYQTALGQWNNTMGGILGMGGKVAGGAMMSDERTKQNIDKVGTVFAYNEDAERKKLPIYEWEYKHDPGKRRVGPMAQDVEKIDRGAVTEIGGVKHIKPDRVMGNILRSVMSDINNPYAAGFFFAGEPGVNLKMREKIALAQMMQKQKAPQNIGEGIYSIGDSISDAIMARQLQQQDRDAQLAASKLGAPAEPGAITPLSQAPQGTMPQERETTLPIAAAQRVIPAPGNLPPTGEPGNTGANTFSPPFQPPPDNPPPAAAPPRTWPTPGPIAAPQPYPPLASVARPSVADFGQKPVLAPTPPSDTPVVAQDGDDPRSAAALAMLRQGQTGQPQSQAFAPAAAPPPAPPPTTQGIRPAPPMQVAQAAQPVPVAGYVTPQPQATPGASIAAPTKREVELQAVLAANQGNPYAESSPAARELKHLGEVRAQRQNEYNKRFEEGMKRETELIKLRETQLSDQDKRTLESQESRIRIGDLPAKLREEGLKRQQELITQPGQAGSQSSPLLGTERSPQRTGIPTVDPPPVGVIPAEWAKAQEKKITADAAGLDAAKPELSEALDLMTKIKAHPGKARSIGLLGGLGQLTPEGQGFSALDEQLKGKNLVAAYQKIKGTGPVGEREGENIAKAQAALTKAGTESDYNAALETLETTMRGAVERVERRMNRPVTAYQKTPDDPYAPDIGQIDATWKDGKIRQYIGGDPHNKEKSWKIVR